MHTHTQTIGTIDVIRKRINFCVFRGMAKKKKFLFLNLDASNTINDAHIYGGWKSVQIMMN